MKISLKKVASISLSIAMLSSSTFVPRSDAIYYPKDTILLKKISDGTHIKGRESTFVNSKNGYFPGDNSADDGIVTSGDYVTYKFELNIVPGQARRLEVDFEQNADGLELADISHAIINNSIVKPKFQNNKWYFDVLKLRFNVREINLSSD